MTDAQAVRVQLRGEQDQGWEGLAAQPEPNGVRWNVFTGQAASKWTLVEAVGRLIWETTLRLNPLTSKEAKERGAETMLGHSAIASGVALENAETLARVEAKLDKVLESK